jgi:2-amino-4-hydroxy-6-hydroxymethyldihydropteridine diphosphokinase
MKTAYLSLGSNLSDRETNLRRALHLLASPDLHIKRTSAFYETEPQDLPHQPWFLNLVVEIETTVFPLQLLARTQKIEKDLGRRRVVPKGPRTIDIDILLFGNFAIDNAKLTVPHPRMHQRRFVLEPLAELAPDLRHPISRRTIREMLNETSGQIVKKLGNQIRDER